MGASWRVKITGHKPRIIAARRGGWVCNVGRGVTSRTFILLSSFSSFSTIFYAIVQNVETGENVRHLYII